MKNFKLCKWDLNDALPEEYANIYRFQDFTKTHRDALACRARMSDQVGSFVSLELPLDASCLMGCRALFGLLAQEEKRSVLNFTVQLENPLNRIASKTPMLAFMGFQELIVQPVFSDASSNSVHKYNRFLRGAQPMMASIYGPVLYPPCPVLLFPATGESGEESSSLLVQGSVVDNNPNRLCLKRVTLTGTPYKINRKSAVIRFMFFNAADVMYYKPVQLVTRSGIKGHIKESLGTKGYMKCVFEKPIQQQEVICLHLYKRQFPK